METTPTLDTAPAAPPHRRRQDRLHPLTLVILGVNILIVGPSAWIFKDVAADIQHNSETLTIQGTALATKADSAEVAALELRVSDRYVKKADYRADMDEIKFLLREINNKLDHKADKSEIR